MSDVLNAEGICQVCGGTNPVWSAPSPLWNEVIRGGDIDGAETYSFVCPVCFIALAEERGVASLWRLYAVSVHVPLQETTPTGRTWNPQTWLFDDAPREDVLNAADWREIAKRAETRWMSVEDAEITVPARSVALASRELNAAEAQVEQLRGERDGWQATAEVLQDSEAMADLFESERERADAAQAAARAGGCAADLAESWELSAERALARRLPEDEMHAERAKAAVFRTCARELRDALVAYDRAASGQTAEKEKA